jgi:branched-chain amino acid transport system ATP-binding protein
MTRPILVCSGLTLRFGGVVAVDGLDLAVEEGEILGIIGPNGAGKTSLLNAICQLDPPTDGTVHFRDLLLNGRSPEVLANLGVARTFQIVKSFGGLSVRQNAAIGAMFGHRRSSVTAALRKADEVLDFVGLGHRRHSSVMHLPLAERKRLELARALAMDPQLLLLDEVMAGLNAAAVAPMMCLVQEVRATGMTVMIIEHLVRAIMGICDRILVLHVGRRIALGTPQEIASDPEVVRAYLGHRYVAASREG